MLVSQQHKVSRKSAKHYFSSVGLFLLLYTLLITVFPLILNLYLSLAHPELLHDALLVNCIYFLLLFFGTVIPFFIMRKAFGIPFKKFNRNSSVSMIDAFVQTLVFFTVCILLTYLSNIIFSYFKIGDKLISSIGLSYDTAQLFNPLYVFTLVIATPIIEEYAFRGVLLSTLGKFGKKFGLIASSLLFALAHTNFAEMIPAFAMGYYLGATALRYKSIRPGIIIHILFNLFIYGLCVVPPFVAQYMNYGLVLVFLLAIYFMISGKYQRVKILSLPNNRNTKVLFYTRFTIVLTVISLLLKSFLYIYIT